MVLRRLRLALSSPKERREGAKLRKLDLGPRAPVAPKAPPNQTVVTRVGVLAVLEKAEEIS